MILHIHSPNCLSIDFFINFLVGWMVKKPCDDKSAIQNPMWNKKLLECTMYSTKDSVMKKSCFKTFDLIFMITGVNKYKYKDPVNSVGNVQAVSKCYKVRENNFIIPPQIYFPKLPSINAVFTVNHASTYTPNSVTDS